MRMDRIAPSRGKLFFCLFFLQVSATLGIAYAQKTEHEIMNEWIKKIKESQQPETKPAQKESVITLKQISMSKQISIRANRVILDGEIYTNGHHLTIYAQHLEFKSGGIIRGYPQNERKAKPQNAPNQEKPQKRCTAKDGATGESGTDGEAGQKGEHGNQEPGAVRLLVEKLHSPRIHLRGQPGQNGQDGCNGGKGGNGQQGTTASQYTKEVRRCTKHFLFFCTGHEKFTVCDERNKGRGGKGGNGGNGGKGGNGGDGGNGGKAILLRTMTIETSRNKQHIDSKPGQGGKPGQHGEPGQPGKGGEGGEGGACGSPGESGKPGVPGTKESKPAKKGTEGPSQEQGNENVLWSSEMDVSQKKMFLTEKFKEIFSLYHLLLFTKKAMFEDVSNDLKQQLKKWKKDSFVEKMLNGWKINHGMSAEKGLLYKTLFTTIKERQQLVENICSEFGRLQTKKPTIELFSKQWILQVCQTWQKRLEKESISKKFITDYIACKVEGLEQSSYTASNCD